MLAQAYQSARDLVVAAGHADEIAWQARVRLEDVTEPYFLRENAWVVLCSGMRESIVRTRFARISDCFLNWESAAAIVGRQSECRHWALQHFNYPGKIDAIICTAKRLATEGFEAFMAAVSVDPISTLQSLPFIGPVTSHHLAKNIGVPVAKPDRHLLRLAAVAGYGDVQSFCTDISDVVGDPVHVVDLVLWRFATIEPAYLQAFSEQLA